MAITNPTLKDVQARRADVARQRRILESEDQDLAVAERILLQLANSKVSDVSQSPVRTQGKGQKWAVLDALEQGELFQDQEAVREAASRLHGIEIKITSLQPLISKLKTDGLLVRQGNKLALASRYAQEQEGGGLADQGAKLDSEPPAPNLGL